eukprot:gene15994-22128_t
MAVEPDAALLGDVVAFYTPAGGEFDANRFAVSLRTQETRILSVGTSVPVTVLSVQVMAVAVVSAFCRSNAMEEMLVDGCRDTHPVGGTSVPVTVLSVQVMAFAFKEQPRQSDQLLCGPASAGGAGRLLALAALSEAADFIADIISDQWRSSSSSHGSWAIIKPQQPEPAEATGAADTWSLEPPKTGCLGLGEARLPRVAHSCAEVDIDMYRSLSGQCMRIARMDMLLLTSFLLRPLTVSSHLCEADDVKDVNPCIGQLIRTATRIADELTPQLRPSKLLYVAGCVSTCAARSCMWLLPEIYDINKSGAERMPTLLNLMPAMASGILVDKLDLRQQRARVYDLARSYYSLLPLPPQEVIRAAADKPMQFSFPAWIAIFEIYGVSRAEKFVGVLGNVVGVMQTPAEVITDTLTDVLKVGGGVLMAGGGLVLSGAMIPVQQLRKVVGSIADKLTEGGR